METGNRTNLPTWTISAWVRSPAAPANAVPSGPIHRQANYQISWNHTSAAFRGAAAVRVGGVWHAASLGPLTGNTWYYLAATYDGETLRAYKDGVLITSNTAPSGPPNSDANSLKLGTALHQQPVFPGHSRRSSGVQSGSEPGGDSKRHGDTGGTASLTRPNSGFVSLGFCMANRGEKEFAYQTRETPECTE